MISAPKKKKLRELYIFVSIMELPFAEVALSTPHREDPPSSSPIENLRTRSGVILFSIPPRIPRFAAGCRRLGFFRRTTARQHRLRHSQESFCMSESRLELPTAACELRIAALSV